MSKYYITSPFLNKFSDEEGNDLYLHSLNGRFSPLNQSELQIIEHFLKRRPLTREYAKSPSFNKLCSMNFIVPTDLNERQFMTRRNEEWINKVSSGYRVKTLTLVVSDTCNFRCPMCLQRKQINHSKNRGIPKLMDWQTSKLAIDKYFALQTSSHDNCSIHFGSAEPLMNWPIIKKSVEYIKTKNPNCKLAISTNLSLLTEERAWFLKKHSVQIRASLDGPQTGNDKLRKTLGGEGTYEVIIEKINLLKRINYPLKGIAVIVNDLNFASIDDDFLLWVKEEGFEFLILGFDLINEKNCSFPLESYVEKFFSIYKFCIDNEIKILGLWTTTYFNIMSIYKNKEFEQPHYCKAIKGEKIAVAPNGNIFNCGHTTTLLAHLNNFDDIFSLESLFTQLVIDNLPNNNSHCFGCEFEGICGGQCYVTKEYSAKKGSSQKISFICDFIRSITPRLLLYTFKKEVGIKC